MIATAIAYSSEGSLWYWFLHSTFFLLTQDLNHKFPPSRFFLSSSPFSMPLFLWYMPYARLACPNAFGDFPSPALHLAVGRSSGITNMQYTYGFHGNSEDSNAGLHNYTASSFTIEPSPSSSFFTLH